MRIDPNKVILVPLTNLEIQTLLLQLQRCVPPVEDEAVVMIVISKLKSAFSMNV